MKKYSICVTLQKKYELHDREGFYFDFSQKARGLWVSFRKTFNSVLSPNLSSCIVFYPKFPILSNWRCYYNLQLEKVLLSKFSFEKSLRKVFSYTFDELSIKYI